ncbi:Sec5p [Sugiyamaella lignohabitans]|uniref:Exocyst complex component SEC5 n=1 Tax=Sugiyamaella lignohabitans TaxID=796027 RepID=A0A167FIW3_9ASCO|nr:Sec5p [Sugiyamaella lignohabitans]ANB15361.1 Sec5p [Sugiyamaella lignohabitans]
MDKAKIFHTYGIVDENAQVWTEEFSSSSQLGLIDKNGDKEGTGISQQSDVHGDLSKYALLRELVSSVNGSSAYSSLQNDEADPLGYRSSVLSALREHGIDVDTDPSVRGKYLISSTKFSSTDFLRDVHSDTTYSKLVSSLSYLEGSISQRSEALRNLVEREYIQFVRSKALLESVLQQVDNTGFNAEKGWGVDSIRANIDDANAKATLVMKPVVDYQKKEERLTAALKLIDKNKYLFNLPSTILKHIKDKNHDLLIRDYRRGRDIKNTTVDITSYTPDYIVQNKKIIDRIWDEVEIIVEQYKQDTWKKLSGGGTLDVGGADPNSNYMQLIAKLLDIGVEDNPILEWIEQQIQILKDQTIDKFEKLKLRSNLMRMNVQTAQPPDEVNFIHPLKELTAFYGSAYHEILIDGNTTSLISPTSSTGSIPSSATGTGSSAFLANPSGLIDAMEIVEMWINIRTIVEDIAAIAAKVCVFWQSCNGFLTGQKQLNLPTGYQGESETHLRFSNYEVNEIKKSGKSLVELFSDRTLEYFTTRVTSNAAGPTGATGTSGLITSGSSLSIAGGVQNRLSGHLASNSSGSSLGQGGQEQFLFSPPFANALSSSKYLGQIISSLYSGFRELSLAHVQQNNAEKLRSVLTTVRERSVYSVCNSWQEDCKKFSLIEDWTRAPRNDSLTKFPQYFQTYHYAVLSGIKRIVFFSPENESSELVAPPPNKLLKQILNEFANAMQTSISSIMTALSKSLDAMSASKRFSNGSNLTSVPLADLMDPSVIDQLSPQELTPDLKVLLVLSNLVEIRENILPRLFKYFERSFMTSSKEVSASLRSRTDEMETNLFELYTRQKRSTLSDAVREGILLSGINWLTADDSSTISKYVYECLLVLVSVHARVHYVSQNLAKRVITVLFEHLLKALLTYFRQVEKFGKGGALRALKDVRFIRYVMKSYETTDSSKTLQLIYGTLKDATIDRTVWNGDGVFQAVQPTVDAALKSSEVSTGYIYKNCKLGY